MGETVEVERGRGKERERVCSYHPPSYHNRADEPDSSDRIITFRVYDDTFNSSSSLSLSIATVDDQPTTVAVNGSGMYGYTEGNSSTYLTDIVLDDGDDVNSDVTVVAVTIEIIRGAANELLEIASNSSGIAVSMWQATLYTTVHL